MTMHVMTQRREIDLHQHEGLRVRDFVRDKKTGKLGRIVRFVDFCGFIYADIKYWRDDPDSPLKSMMYQVPVRGRLERADDPRQNEEDTENDQ